MKKLLIVIALMAAAGAQAQGFQDEPTCYSWEGGHKSAGSFTKCGPRWEVAKKAPAPPPPAPVVATPVLQSTVCPPQVILQPEPKKPVKRKPKPKPVQC